MIAFEGQITEEVRKRILKEYYISYVWLSLFSIILGLSPLFIIIGANEVDLKLILSVAWMTAGVILAIFILCLPLIVIKEQLPAKIEISEGYLTCNFKRRSSIYGESVNRNLEYVKKVKDFGNYYCIYFRFPHRFIGCVCQKDLLSQGTIEEFEKLFEGKVVRK